VEEITYADLALPSGVYTKLLVPQPPPEPAIYPQGDSGGGGTDLGMGKTLSPHHVRISSFTKESSV
ncbi:hypothetical protein J6590_099351, partial [Homalodisca vitripennis]